MSVSQKIQPLLPVAEAAEAPAVACQVAGLCWRRGKRGVEVLLITSRDTGRWVLPKGWPMKGLDPARSALREAFEEAGVEGKVTRGTLGHYPYVKVMGEDVGFPCEVAVFPIEVGRLKDAWPEAGERRRKWFPIAKAAEKVTEPGLAEILRGFAEGLGAAG